MARTSISCTDDVRDRLNSLRPDGVAWNDFLEDLADAYEEPQDGGMNSNEFADVADEVEKLQARVDELESSLPERTAEALERRLSRR